jgi:hypothetical protein
MLKNRLYNEESEVCLRILAIGIYGLFLFPSIERMIDFKVNVLKSEIALTINPTTMVLAETLASLNHYRKVGKSHLRYCL